MAHQIRSETVWWDADRIDRTVTRHFVCNQLLPDEIARLDTALGFGDGLTDGTYWEWIDEKAKRIFLILVDLGIPDQIFGIIDDSWDDDDLPIAMDQVERLALTPSKDEKAERRFYYRQFLYLLKPLEKGEHIVYEDAEVPPVDIVERRQGNSHTADKVELPNHPGQVFCRRRVLLGTGPGCLSYDDFLYEINAIRNLQNTHMVSYWASYVHDEYGYVLFTPTSDLNLKSFLANTPNGFKNLTREARRELIMNWIHCLVDTLCFIHSRGLSLGNIRPSTVLLGNDNHIFFADFTRFSTDMVSGTPDKSSFDKEFYDYAAPEQWFRPTTSHGGQRKATLTSLSSSPDNTTFAISRGDLNHGSSRPEAMIHAPNPQLNPQAADIFSLGCVVLELLGLLLKKQGRAFAAHRSAKHKTPGRGGAVLDASFHKNLGQVESWMSVLAKDAVKKDAAFFRAVPPLLHVVERMLAMHPSERPSAHDVQTRMYQILTEACGISEPHCVHQYGSWDFGMGSLRLGSSTIKRNNSGDTMSITTKRSSGTVRSLEHRRTHSGGSVTTRASVISASPSRSYDRPPPSVVGVPREHQNSVLELGTGLQAIRDLRLPSDK